MIYEVIYTKQIFNNFEDHIKNVFKVNFEKDCFVYFHYGEKASNYLDKKYPNDLNAYQYIKELEQKFNVNINWINLSFIFDNIKMKVDIDDLERIIFYYKTMYFNSIEKFIKENKK